MKTKLLLLSVLMVAMLTSCLKDKTVSVTHNYTPEQYATISQHLNLPVEVDNYTLTLPETLGGFVVGLVAGGQLRAADG